MSEDYKTSSQSAPGSLAAIIQRYYLQSEYANLKRLLYEKKFPIAQSFINLALIKETEQKQKDEQTKSANAEIRDSRINSFEDIHKPKEPIKIAAIFDPLTDDKKPNRILIQGRAGIGKTTLCQFIANQGAAEDGSLKAWRAQFKLVIWLPLRQIIANENFDFKKLDLAEVIHHRFLNRRQRKQYSIADIRAELEALIAAEQSLLILDGYDEIVPILNFNKDFKEFFEEEVLGCSQWVLASRPRYASNIKADRCLENIGFISADIPCFEGSLPYKNLEQKFPLFILIKRHLWQNKN